MSEPTTAAGRALGARRRLLRLASDGGAAQGDVQPHVQADRLLDEVEAEARATLRAELAAKVEALPTGKAKSMRWNLPTQTVELLSRAAVLALLSPTEAE